MSRNKCRIPESEIGTSEVDLGKFIDGYDSYYDSIPWVTLIVRLFFSILFFYAIYLILPYYNEFWGLMLIFFCGGLLFPILTATLFINSFMKRTQVLIYEYGFIWKIANRNGETIKQYIVDFNDVDAIKLSKTLHYKLIWYQYTSYQFIVWSKGGQQFFKKTGSYKNENEDMEIGGCEYFSLQTIMERWNQIELIRLASKLIKT